MSVISSAVLRRRLFDTSDERERLYVVPILDLDGQIRPGQSAIDVRLGTDFIFTRRVQLSHIDPYSGAPEERAQHLKQYQEKLVVGLGSRLILHPQQFAIGGTLEYFRLPLDLAGMVVGRSSWARLGLVIAMATMVHPGYTGVITLELQNLGDAPIALYPGARIGQIVFYEATGNEELEFQDLRRGAKYVGAISAGFSRLSEDAERERILRFKQHYREASTFLR